MAPMLYDTWAELLSSAPYILPAANVHNLRQFDHGLWQTHVPCHHHLIMLSPPQAKNEESASKDDHDVASTTHQPTSHHPHLGATGLASIPEEVNEGLDETSRTHHEPIVIIAAATTTAADVNDSGENSNSAGVVDVDEASNKIHRKVAQLAANSYQAASKKSHVLSNTILADLALVNIGELTIGKFLGSGSFSDVHEITNVAASGDDNEDDNEDNGNLNPRTLLTKHHERTESGTYRYAIKFLRSIIRSDMQRYAVGTVDLVLEGMFLASLNHPNIIKVRALPMGGVRSLLQKENHDRGYFLVLDRLFNTLGEQIYKVWSPSCPEGHQMCIRKMFGMLPSRIGLKKREEDLAVRLKVAFDLCAALKYLHSKNIIYRDLKPENLGFDVRGDIKLFDLGLVKELHPNDKDIHDNYKLSLAGTPRYMAPEVAMHEPYNLSADVYSFSMLLWEIVTLEKPMANYTYAQLKTEIFIDGGRPPLKNVFNKKMRDLISMGWSQRPKERPSMDAVYEELRNEYLRITKGNVSEIAVTHDRRRSTHVARSANGGVSLKHLMSVK